MAIFHILQTVVGCPIGPSRNWAFLCFWTEGSGSSLAVSVACSKIPVGIDNAFVVFRVVGPGTLGLCFCAGFMATRNLIIQ